MPQHKEEQLSSELIFEGKVICVTRDEILLENNKTAIREVVHHNGGAAVVAINAQGEVALVRQFRYAAGAELIEIPAGKIDPGENPRQTAIRELAEEAGCTADIFTDFGSIIPTCAYCTEVIYLYLAKGLHPVAQKLDDDEFLDVFWLPLQEAVDMVLRGEITDSKTVAALLKAKVLHSAGTL